MKVKHLIVSTLCFCPWLYADIGLKELMKVIHNNESYQSQLSYQEKAQKEHESSQKEYFPTVDMIAGRDTKFKKTSYEPQNSDYMGLRASYILFDGFKREAKIASQKSVYDAQTYKSEFTKQQLLLSIIKEYYTIQNAKSGMLVIDYKLKELEENIKNVTVLVHNDLATNDKVHAMIASKKEAEYDLESMKLQLESSRLKLLHVTGLSLSLEKEEEFLREAESTNDGQRADIEADKNMAQSLEFALSQYTYMPTIAVQYAIKNNNYSAFEEQSGTTSLPKQSSDLSLQFSFPLFDAGKISKDKEAARWGLLALHQEIAYKEKEAKMEQEIAKRALDAARIKLNAANAALNATSMAYEYAKKRFRENLISHTDYLSELTKKEEAYYRSIAAKNEIELKKAEYAFAMGIDLATLLGES